MSYIPSFSSIWGSKKGSLEKLSDNNILNIANELEMTFSEMNNIPHSDLKKVLPNNKKLELPHLVVVGTQSSGKSTVLNRIITKDILPTGGAMVTRTPLNIQLVKTTDRQTKVEFGSNVNNKWEITKSFILSEPSTKEELTNIQLEIEKQTDILAGTNKNISHNMLIIKVYSNTVPNLSLIDLPGLTMVACTDKGQPADIKEQIRKMIGNYIQSERTIILAVMAARQDLEADMALDLIKEYDPNYDRTIGVLTKIDLMNKNADIRDYLEDNISKDLKLAYGYYGVQNIGDEMAFFKQHPVYQNVDCSKLGIENVSECLSKILIQHLKKLLPEVAMDLMKVESQVDIVLEELGYSVPFDDKDKYSMLHSLISEFSKQYIRIVEDDGRLLKDIFVDFRNRMELINPFTLEEYTDGYIVNVVKNCEGNHMSCVIPPVEVLEKCMLDSDKNPIDSLKRGCYNCVNSIIGCLESMMDKLLNGEVSRFPNLSKLLKDKFNLIIEENKKKVIVKINELIGMEEVYIWTDEDMFREMLSESGVEPDKIRELLVSYFDTVKKTMRNVVPKAIMFHLVKNVEREMSTLLFDVINKEEVGFILKEKSDVNDKRVLFENYKKKIVAVKKLGI
jgi:dynamin 1-like protein